MIDCFRWFLPTLLLFCCSSEAEATQNGHWNIVGTVVNVEGQPFPKQCEVANLELRFRSRWANGQGCAGDECPWGASWGKTRTNSQGRFSKQSPAFVHQNRQRDVLIEYRVNGNWMELTMLPDVGEFVSHTTQGNTWIFDFGSIETDKFECQLELTDAPSQSKPELAIDDSAFGSADKSGKKEPGTNEGQKGNACGNIDLEIVNSIVRRRSPEEVPGHIRWEVTIRNNGTETYPGTGKCKTSVRLELFVSNNNVRKYDRSIYEAIPPGESRTFTSLRGNFDNDTSELAAKYNVLFTVDPENKIAETNEQNNTQPGCYGPFSENYQEGSCNEKRVDNSGSGASGIAPNARMKRGRVNRWTTRRN